MIGAVIEEVKTRCITCILVDTSSVTEKPAFDFGLGFTKGVFGVVGISTPVRAHREGILLGLNAVCLTACFHWSAFFCLLKFGAEI